MGLLGLPSITTGQGSNPSYTSSSAAESAVRSDNVLSTGDFNVGSSQGTTNIVLIIAGVIALAFLFFGKRK
jgi:LPXTG-motif cell wall-anchored protein